MSFDNIIEKKISKWVEKNTIRAPFQIGFQIKYVFNHLPLDNS